MCEIIQSVKKKQAGRYLYLHIIFDLLPKTEQCSLLSLDQTYFSFT